MNFTTIYVLNYWLCLIYLSFCDYDFHLCPSVLLLTVCSCTILRILRIRRGCSGRGGGCSGCGCRGRRGGCGRCGACLDVAVLPECVQRFIRYFEDLRGCLGPNLAKPENKTKPVTNLSSWSKAPSLHSSNCIYVQQRFRDRFSASVGHVWQSRTIDSVLPSISCLDRYSAISLPQCLPKLGIQSHHPSSLCQSHVPWSMSECCLIASAQQSPTPNTT